MNSECRGYLYYSTLLSVLLAVVISLAGCTNPEKAKAEHLRKGEAYLAELKYQEASLEFRNALQIDDKLPAAHWGLARAFAELQRFPEMFQELQRTVELDPNNFDARVRLGNYYVALSKGKPEVIAMAEKLAQEILQKDPNHVEGHILMGSILFARDKKDEAFAELNKAIDLDPKRVESYLSLARFYIVTRDQAKAEELFKRALSVNPNSPLAHTEYGKFLVQMSRPVEAEAELRKAVEVGPNDRTSRFVLASYYLVNKQLDKAEESFKALAALDPDKPESQATLADFYSTIDRIPEATKIYQDLLAKSPDFTQGRYRLAEILLMHGDTQGASTYIADALKKDATDRQALLLRARMRAQSGQTDGLKAAIEDLKEVLKQDPTSRGGLYYMAQANFNLGLIDQARAFTGDLEKNYPDYLPAKLMKVQITLSSRDPKNAVAQATDLLDRLGKAAPDRETSPQLLAEIRQKAYLARGSAQLQLGNSVPARQDFEAARDVNPNDPNPYNNLAMVALAEKKSDEAIAQWENALKTDNANFVALSGFVSLYAQQQQAYDKAHARIDLALSANQNNASLHFLKAQIYGYQRNGQGAEAELRKALELDPNYLPAYSALGALFINSGQTDRAIAEFQNMIKIRPEDQSAYTMIGMLEDSRKNFDAAADSYKKALEKDPNAVIPANNLAWLYAVTGSNLDEAVKLAQGVVQRNPNIAGFVDTLGWVYYKKNLYAAAAEQLQKAIKLDEEASRETKASPSASYHYHLGMALKAKGDQQGAKRELEASLRLSEKSPFSDIEEARKALTSL